MQDYTETAWAAGFFDGEGAVMAQRRTAYGRKNTLRLEVTQMRREPLERFMDAMGGVGSIHQDARGCYRFQTNNKNVDTVRDLLWPYLSVPSREKFERASSRLASFA